MANNVSKPLPVGAYDELLVSEYTSIGQFDATYGIVNSAMVDTVDNGGTVTSSNSKFILQSSTGASGLAVLTTRRYINYKPGQGIVCEISALFPDGGALSSIQIAGFITSENSIGFGYVNGDFGVIRLVNGIPEYQELTITTFAAGVEVATVTVDGVAYPVNLTGAGTLIDDAYEIASQLDGVVPNYIITSNNDQVLAQAIVPGVAGSFAYTSATSAGTWAQIDAGAPVTPIFTPQSSWSEDTKQDLQPDKGNVYKIQAAYLGFGNIRFYIKDKESGEFVFVHQEKFSNTNTLPSSTTSSFRAGWATLNTGNTTNISIEGSSTGQFIEGKNRLTGPLFGDSNTQTGVTTALTNVLTIRNREHFGSNINRVEIYPRLVTAGTDTTKSAIFDIILNATFGANMDYQYVDKSTSVAEYTKTSASVSGGKKVGNIRFRSGASPIIRFNDSERSDTVIEAGQTLTIAAAVSGGAASEMDASITWQEDL